MPFNSISFLIFFPLVTLGYFIVPKKLKTFWLLLASYYFYAFLNPIFLVLLFGVTLVSYTATRLFSYAKQKPLLRKFIFILNLLCCLAGLVTFKALNFMNPSIVVIGGISFYTFQAVGYSIDVYKEKYPAEKNFIVYALFVSFFPTILSGPIERGGNLIPQLKQIHQFDYDRVSNGLFTMLWGFFKKMVIADGFAVIVSSVYSDPQKFSGPALLLTTILFAFQIYCDFSGYSDIAIGTASILGFSLAPNFRQPYFSSSIGEFWNRWHISLSSWFKDYLYIPLGGNRKGKIRTYLNLMIVFLVSGIWHGASLTYIVWGALHGLYSIVGRITSPLRKKLKTFFYLDKIPRVSKLVSILATFALVCISWIFFKASSLDDAIYILTHITTGFQGMFTTPEFWQTALSATNFFTKNGPALCACLLVLWGGSLWEAGNKKQLPLAHRVRATPFYVRWPIYYGLILLILFFGNFGISQFIYAQY